jgi:high-affinity iron transporter
VAPGLQRSLRTAFALAALAVALVATASASAATGPAPWKQASELRGLLADAEKTLILDGPKAAGRLVRQAEPVASALARRLSGASPQAAARIERGVAEAGKAVEADDLRALAAARADVQTAILLGAYRSLMDAIAAGDATDASRWLLVREFRTPTRFSRPGADATLAVRGLANGRVTPKAAAASVRADLLDTYQARLRSSLETADGALEREFGVRAAAESALARGYAAILLDAYRAQKGAAAADAFQSELDRLATAAAHGDTAAYRAARASIDDALSGFRAAPLAQDELVRRAGQFLRFLALVPVEYGRGVRDGKVALDFEIQEAITFRDGAAQALGDLDSVLVAKNRTATKRLEALVARLGTELASAAQGGAVADPDALKSQTDEALDLANSLFPDDWKDAGSTADFDVIQATLDRVQAAVAAGEYAKAEQARLEAYAFFEFGPEQRLRGLAPSLFVRVEGLFWYGADGYPGLAQLVKRKASPAEVAETRTALDTALADAEQAVGSGPQSTVSVITNTAIIVFREGLEAVLILAALTAGMAGAQLRYRRPLLLGALVALGASVVTFVVAQTVLESLNRYGEKLEAIVSLVAIGVLLLILNWFFHRVYWSEHLAELHGKKKTLLRSAGLSLAAAQVAGLVMLGFSSVYREGFETVLFLQAIALEAGVGSVVEGVLLGLAGVAAIGVLTIFLQRKLPHKRMLELTGLLILAVLAVMVGKTVQVCQVVGWLPVNPIEGVTLPYWAGQWFGVFPTWEGVAAQAFAVVLVLGSYGGAEIARRRRRRRILGEPAAPSAATPATSPAPAPVRRVPKTERVS